MGNSHQSKLKELIRTIAVLWERSLFCDPDHPISVFKRKKAPKQHTVFTSPAFTWPWNDELWLRQRFVSAGPSTGFIPYKAPSQTAAAPPAAGGEPPCQYLRSFLSPLGEQSPNLGVTQVTLQEGAFSQIKFSRR